MIIVFQPQILDNLTHSTKFMPQSVDLETNRALQRDLDLVASTQGGDRDAFGSLYKAHVAEMHRYLLRHLNGRQEAAEDIGAGAWLRTLERLDTFQDRRLPFKAWLYTVFKNYLIDEVRRLPSNRRVTVISLEAVPETQLIASTRDFGKVEAIDEVEPALHRLTPDQRNVVTLRFLDGFTTTETAEALGKTPEAVKKLQARAFAQMRRIIELGRTTTDSPVASDSNGHEHAPAFGLAGAVLARASRRNGSATIAYEPVAETLAPAPDPEKPHTNGHRNGTAPNAAQVRRMIVFGYDESRDTMKGNRLAQQEQARIDPEQATSSIIDLSQREDALLKQLLPDDPTRHPDLNTMLDVAASLDISVSYAYVLRKSILKKLVEADGHEGPLPRRLRLQLNRLSENQYYSNRSWDERQALIKGINRGPLGFKQLIAMDGSNVTEVLSPIERNHMINHRDLSRLESQFADILFPPPDQYPMVTTLREAGALIGVGPNNASYYRSHLAHKLHAEDESEALMDKPRKRELLARLGKIALYAYTTPEERDEIMWFELDKAALEKIAAERAKQ